MASAVNPYAKVVAQSWSDKAYKQRLQDDPHAALAEHGIDIPGNTKINVVENTGDTVHLVLPAEPDGEIGEEDLAKRDRRNLFRVFSALRSDWARDGERPDDAAAKKVA